MDELNRKEKLNEQMVEGCTWVPEYGAWMVEATPNRPYTGYTTDLLRVERNMRLRRKRFLTVLALLDREPARCQRAQQQGAHRSAVVDREDTDGGGGAGVHELLRLILE
mgnify:CR=1 FL=1